MKRKKRYVLLKDPSPALAEGGKILFRSKDGYVVKVSIKCAEHLRPRALYITGSIRKLKGFGEREGKPHKG